MNILIGDTQFTWKLLHAKRKTVRMRLISSTALEITAPPTYQPQEAEAFIRAKAKWIQKTALKLAAEEKEAAKHFIESGQPLPFMGESYILYIAYHPVKPSVRLDGSLLRVCLPPESKREMLLRLLINWYVEQARQILGQKTVTWARIIGVNPVSVTIRDPKTRWGSCSTRGSINYSWRVILAPLSVIDYLVVHELCHLLEPNHSLRYWQTVALFLPDYQNSRRWLTLHGGALMRLFS